jgi:hypothetical protein
VAELIGHQLGINAGLPTETGMRASQYPVLLNACRPTESISTFVEAAH